MKISAETIELLAERVHKRWMKNRQAEGWEYGKTRNDITKETSCLVLYSELPEIEKEYDRATVRETLEGLRELGYEIVKKTEL